MAGHHGGEAPALSLAPSRGKRLDRCAGGAHLLWERWTAPARRVGRGVCSRRRAPSQTAEPTPDSWRAVADWGSARAYPFPAGDCHRGTPSAFFVCTKENAMLLGIDYG